MKSFVTVLVDIGVRVRYGKTKSLEMTQTKFTFKTYKASDMCETLANTTGFWDPGFIYDVLLTDLEPNTRYFYSCGSEEVGCLFLAKITKLNKLEYLFLMHALK